MKKIIALVLLLLLTGCDFLDNLTDTKTVPSGTPTVFTEEEIPPTIVDYDFNGFKQLFGSMGNQYMPSTGDVKVLVVPVYFGDQTVLDLLTYSRTDLEKAFFGQSSDTGWESLSSFYKKSSYGKLNITGTVAEWYQTNYSADYYTSKYANYDAGISDTNPVDLILEEVMDAYEYTYNFNDYDSDGDGTVDAIYLVYAKPPYDSHGEITNQMYWAWCSWYYGMYKLDGLDVYPYVWVSFDFIHLDEEKDYCIPINSDVLIHESGHLMGADDYYDYNSTIGTKYGVGSYDMMDNNCGDHNPATKVLMDWTTPKIMTSGKSTFTLNGFSTSGDSVIICSNWNSKNNIKQEFFIVDFYNQDNLNADYQFLYDGYHIKTSGIRIYHVNAEMDKSGIIDPYYTFKYNNSSTDYGFIALVDNYTAGITKDDFVKINEDSDASCLFLKGDSFTPNKYCQEYKNLNILNFTLTVNDITATNATITIEFK